MDGKKINCFLLKVGGKLHAILLFLSAVFCVRTKKLCCILQLLWVQSFTHKRSQNPKPTQPYM